MDRQIRRGRLLLRFLGIRPDKSIRLISPLISRQLTVIPVSIEIFETIRFFDRSFARRVRYFYGKKQEIRLTSVDKERRNVKRYESIENALIASERRV